MKELTNGGKPHICGKIQVYNSKSMDEISLCAKCNLAVDSDESNPHPNKINQIIEEFDFKFPRLGEDSGFDSLLRFYRLDLPTGDSRSMETFLRTSLESYGSFIEGETRKEILDSLPREFWEDSDHAVGGYISKKDLKALLEKDNTTKQ